MNGQSDIRINKNTVLFALLLAGFVSVFGCSGHSGRMLRDRDVTSRFENYEVLSDHRYYYFGSVGRPRAVIGIQESYTLKSDLWVPVDLTTEQLKDWMGAHGPYKDHFKGTSGSVLLSGDGSRIGVMYAFIDWKDWVSVRMVDDRTVAISAPIYHDEPVFFWNMMGVKEE